MGRLCDKSSPTFRRGRRFFIQAVAAALLLAAGLAYILWLISSYGVRDTSGALVMHTEGAQFIILTVALLAVAAGVFLLVKACTWLALEKARAGSGSLVCSVTLALHGHRQRVSRIADIGLVVIAISALISIAAGLRWTALPLFLAAVLTSYVSCATNSAGEVTGSAEKEKR